MSSSLPSVLLVPSVAGWFQQPSLGELWLVAGAVLASAGADLLSAVVGCPSAAVECSSHPPLSADLSRPPNNN